MPWFYFDLIVEDRPYGQGGMILENIHGARERADALAIELCKIRPDLNSERCSVRVINDANEEVYRTRLGEIVKRGV